MVAAWRRVPGHRPPRYDHSRLAFERDLKVPYPSIADVNATLAVDYRIPSAPALVFLDTKGKVGDVVLGALGTMSSADFNAEIAKLLGPANTGSA